MNDKEIFSRNLQHYMELNNKSRNDICQALGFNYYTFTDWVNAKKYPRIDKVQKLADYFGVLKSDLIEDKKPAQERAAERAAFDAAVAKDEDLRSMIKMYKALPDEKKKTIRQMIEDYYNAFA